MIFSNFTYFQKSRMYGFTFHLSRGDVASGNGGVSGGAYLRSLSHTESIERICPVMPSILHNTFPYPAAPSLRFPPRRRRPRFTVADIRGRIAFDVRHRFHIRCVEYSFPRNVGCSGLAVCDTPLGL